MAVTRPPIPTMAGGREGSEPISIDTAAGMRPLVAGATAHTSRQPIIGAERSGAGVNGHRDFSLKKYNLIRQQQEWEGVGGQRVRSVPEIRFCFGLNPKNR